MKKPSPILQKASDYVFNLLREKLPANHIYHNFQHTSDVVESTEEIAEAVDLSKEDTEIVMLAAWFHDTGFIEKDEGHEEKSKEIAARFLKENLYPQEKIEKILNCIEATRYPQQPKNLLEYVLCDADLSGIASKKYFDKANFLRREIELVQNRTVSDKEWYNSEIKFLTNHKYHTQYAHLNFDKRKNEHVLELRTKLQKIEEEEAKKREKTTDKEKAKEEKEKRPERGIETMFRITVSNHMNLSKMADDKANFLLSINGIILSFAIGNILAKFDTPSNRFLIIPTALLMIICLIAIVFSILSTRPKLSIGKYSREDIEKRKANLLFFGNFYNMSLEDFDWGFHEMMSDKDFLYSSLIKDLYYLGKVLGRKYQYLRIAYTVFMYGIVVSVTGYAVSYYYYVRILGDTSLTITPVK
ncbi:MAG TPA: Pycsar system effector family protein [Chitinophagales bacterium]|nr:Pycsar system effector family protein [Chitinophagales bacterium]